MYRRDPIHSSSPPPAPPARRSPFSERGDDDIYEAFATQPTLPLNGHAGVRFAHVALPTQPTQMLSSPLKPRVQVVRSSPAAERYSSPPMSQMSQSQRPPNSMMPPDTWSAQAVPHPRPVYVESDDPPVESDPEEQDYKGSNIPPNRLETRIEETPQKPSFNMYEYDVHSSRKRPADDPSTPPRDKKPRPAPRQSGPARALPVQADISLGDIHDFGLRTNVHRLQMIAPTRSTQELYNILKSKKGNYGDAVEYVTREPEPSPALETSSEDDLLVKTSHSYAKPSGPVYQPKKTAQRQLNAPIQSLTERYSTIQKNNVVDLTGSPERPKKKGRLVRGRRNRTPTPEPEAQLIPQRSKPTPIIVESDDEDEGVVIPPDDSEEEAGEEEDDVDLVKLLEFFNTCSVQEMVDLSDLNEDDIRATFDHRPFISLDEVETIHVDSRATGNKKPRKPKFTFGSRLVQSATAMWAGFETVDELVESCKEIGKPLATAMRSWGLDLFGASKEGELALTSIDDLSDTNSNRDSGIGTPRSSHDSDTDADSVRRGAPRISSGRSSKANLLKKPANMSEDIELKDYQVVGLNWLNLLWQNQVSGILADDMGLGKTCQVIAFLSHLKQTNAPGPHLIVVPGSTLENWLREFKQFSPGLSEQVEPYYGLQASRAAQQAEILANLDQIYVIVTTYDLACKDADNAFLRKCQPKACIFDEGHLLRNCATRRYKTLNRIRSTCRFLLTGTPLQNSLRELASILAFIMPDLFKEKEEKLGAVFKTKAKVNESDTHGRLLSTQRILRARSMLTPFVLRRKKAQVLKHLPKKTTRVEYCELTESQSRLYSAQLERQKRVLLDRAAGKQIKDHAYVMMKLRQAAIHPLLFRDRYDNEKIRKISKACLKDPTFQDSNPDVIYEELELYQDYQCHHLATKYPRALGRYALKNDEWMDSGKVQKLAELLKKFKENGDRTLVFSQFTSVMDILQWVLDTLDISYFRLDGSTPVSERQSLLDLFYEDETIPVFMLSTKSGGAGINLACANKVIIFDSSFNPQDDIQAENRAHRVGQTQEVEVVRLVTKGTVEEQIHALGVSKLELDKMVSGEEGATDANKPGDKLSAAEEKGIDAVEQMMLEQLKQGGGGDIKEDFLDGLKAAGLDLSAA